MTDIKPPSVGDIVYFTAPRFTRQTPVAAIVTGLVYAIEGKMDERHIALTAFPPGQPPVPLMNVPHRTQYDYTGEYNRHTVGVIPVAMRCAPDVDNDPWPEAANDLDGWWEYRDWFRGRT